MVDDDDDDDGDDGDDDDDDGCLLGSNQCLVSLIRCFQATNVWLHGSNQ